ncbi:hypothetical protein JKP88DRAFT_282476 [Tribonema minus]|uniref:Uncharacterized protein n=1 Tax=Tribonema minus TaxID=303371 RepID=A0A836C9K0_9STRA|nr:hypothetical protein JKP88DRAFT_282476 [Tribonema minus]
MRLQRTGELTFCAAYICRCPFPLFSKERKFWDATVKEFRSLLGAYWWKHVPDHIYHYYQWSRENIERREQWERATRAEQERQLRQQQRRQQRLQQQQAQQQSEQWQQLQRPPLGFARRGAPLHLNMGHVARKQQQQVQRSGAPPAREVNQQHQEAVCNFPSSVAAEEANPSGPSVPHLPTERQSAPNETEAGRHAAPQPADQDAPEESRALQTAAVSAMRVRRPSLSRWRRTQGRWSVRAGGDAVEVVEAGAWNVRRVADAVGPYFIVGASLYVTWMVVCWVVSALYSTYVYTDGLVRSTYAHTYGLVSSTYAHVCMAPTYAYQWITGLIWDVLNSMSSAAHAVEDHACAATGAALHAASAATAAVVSFLKAGLWFLLQCVAVAVGALLLVVLLAVTMAFVRDYAWPWVKASWPGAKRAMIGATKTIASAAGRSASWAWRQAWRQAVKAGGWVGACMARSVRALGDYLVRVMNVEGGDDEGGMYEGMVGGAAGAERPPIGRDGLEFAAGMTSVWSSLHFARYQTTVLNALLRIMAFARPTPLQAILSKVIIQKRASACLLAVTFPGAGSIAAAVMSVLQVGIDTSINQPQVVIIVPAGFCASTKTSIIAMLRNIRHIEFAQELTIGPSNRGSSIWSRRIEEHVVWGTMDQIAEWVRRGRLNMDMVRSLIVTEADKALITEHGAQKLLNLRANYMRHEHWFGMFANAYAVDTHEALNDLALDLDPSPSIFLPHEIDAYPLAMPVYEKTVRAPVSYGVAGGWALPPFG